MNILFYSAELAPYHIACLAALAKGGTCKISVAQAKIKPPHGYDESAHKKYGINVYQGPELSWKWGCKQIEQGSFDLVFAHGYYEPDVRKIISAAKRAKVPLVMKIDNTAYDKKRFWLSDKLKSIYINHYADYVMVPGERGTEYIQSLGFPRARIWRGLFGIDVNFYASEAEKYRLAAAEVRKKLNLPENYFLHCGWINSIKNVSNLVKGYEKYRKQVENPWGLIMLGKGNLESRIKEMNVGGVELRGFVQLNDLPAYYGTASWFCIVSNSDPWPLALLEAVASGLPSIVSWKCGNSVELIREGWNGLLCNPSDPESITDCMVIAHNDKIMRATALAQNIYLASCYSAKAWAQKVDYYLSKINN